MVKFISTVSVLLWRNWLARSAVNRKVRGSSPRRSVSFFFFSPPTCFFFERFSPICLLWDSMLRQISFLLFLLYPCTSSSSQSRLLEQWTKATAACDKSQYTEVAIINDFRKYWCLKVSSNIWRDLWGISNPSSLQRGLSCITEAWSNRRGHFHFTKSQKKIFNWRFFDKITCWSLAGSILFGFHLSTRHRTSSRIDASRKLLSTTRRLSSLCPTAWMPGWILVAFKFLLKVTYLTALRRPLKNSKMQRRLFVMLQINFQVFLAAIIASADFSSHR